MIDIGISASLVQLAPPNPSRTVVIVENAGNTDLAITAPKNRTVKPGRRTTFVGDAARQGVSGLWGGPPLGTQLFGGAVVMEHPGSSSPLTAPDRKQVSHRLKASDRQTKWGLLIQARNTSGLWPHPAPAEGDPADIRIHSGKLQLNRGVASRESTAASIAVVMSVDEASETMRVAFVFGERRFVGGEVEIGFGGDSELRLAVRNGAPVHILTRGVLEVAWEDVPAPAFDDPFSPERQEVWLRPSVGDALLYLRNGGGDMDSVTARGFYTVGDDG